MNTQAAVVHYALEPLAVELREIPIPQIGDGEVLLEVGAVSVCGSDVHQSRNTHSWPVNIPVVLGHEFGGTVARLGRGVTGFREGDRVVSETAAEICGTCLLCRTGRYNLCTARKGFGYGVNGAMAQFVRVPARCLHHIPDSLPFDIACLAEPHSVAYQVMCVNSRIAPGDFVVVIGPGPIGLLCTRMAALSGASTLVVVGLTADRPRLEAARRLGATHTVDIETENVEEIIRDICPIGADLVCDASGASSTLEIRVAAREARRSGVQGRMVAGYRHDRRESSGDARTSGCRDRSATTIPSGSASSSSSTAASRWPTPSSGCAHRSPAGARRSTRCTTGASSSRCCCRARTREPDQGQVRVSRTNRRSEDQESSASVPGSLTS